jgi:hypothetical protein
MVNHLCGRPPVRRIDLVTGPGQWAVGGPGLGACQCSPGASRRSASGGSLIALALVLGGTRKLTYLTATAFSLMIWATAEGFGGPYTGGGADVDVGAGLIYALVFIALLVITCDGPDPYSLDAVIERRLPWWRRLAEFSPHRKDTVRAGTVGPRRLGDPTVASPDSTPHMEIRSDGLR